jgi:RNase P/RNase MRP subunit POP5
MKRVLPKSKFWYLRTQLEFEEEDVHADSLAVRNMITKALGGLHGEIGSSTQVDVLKHEVDTGVSILRVAAKDVVKLWSSLTLLGEYDGRRLRFLVKQFSPFLMSLAVDSRQVINNVST